MKIRKGSSALSMILAVLMAFGMVMPSAAAENSVAGSFREEEELPDGIQEEEGPEETGDMNESMAEGEIPDERGTEPAEEENGGTSLWLSDYSYAVNGDEIILLSYRGSETEVTVPGSAVAEGVIYDRVILTAMMWGPSVTALAFEEGVALPEDSSRMFAPAEGTESGLVSFDGTGLDVSAVKDMSGMFEDCSALEHLDLGSFDLSALVRADHMLDTHTKADLEIITPIGLSVEVDLETESGEFFDEDGNQLTRLPLNLETGRTIVRKGQPALLEETSSEPGPAASEDFQITEEFPASAGAYMAEPADTGAADISLCSVTLDPVSCPFTGANIVPKVTVKKGTAVLKEGTDYTVTCSNNRNAGTASAVITGKGAYSGSLTRTFTITKADQPLQASISAAVLGKGETAQVTASGNKGDLVYASSDSAAAAVDGQGKVSGLTAGEALITVTAKMTMNYNKAQVTIPVRVCSGAKDISGCTVTFDRASYPFTGSAIVPVLTVKNGTLVLKAGTDYTASYSNNRNTGTASVVITGKGAYGGSLTGTFTITKVNQPLQASVSREVLNVGETAQVAASGNKGDLLYTSSNSAVAKVDGQGLVSGLSAGEALITVTAKMTMNYNKAQVTIPVRVCSGAKDIAGCTVIFGKASYPFTGSNILPDLTVKNGTLVLKEGTDYTTAFSNNRNAGTASVLITGKGAYGGTLKKTFSITKVDQPLQASLSRTVLKVGETAQVTASGNKGDLVYTSSNFAVAKVDSQGLVSGLSAGEALITVTAKMTMNYNKAQVTIPVRVCSGTKDIAGCTVTFGKASYPFTGSAIVPDMTVKNGTLALKAGTDYTVSFSNNRNAGTAIAVITGKEAYGGSQTKNFTITKVNQPLEASLSRTVLKVGEAAQAMASGNKGDLLYTSSNSAVAKVDGQGKVSGISAGETVITVTAKMTMNYNKAQVTIPVRVCSGAKDIAGCTVTFGKASYPFTGSAVVPDMTVKNGTIVLKEGTDYTAAYSNNRNTGTASALITGKGSYGGSKTGTFTISKVDQPLQASLSRTVLKVGETAQAMASGNKGDLLYASSDPAVAKVDGQGLISGLSAGEALITVTAKMTMNYNKAQVTIPVRVCSGTKDIAGCTVTLEKASYIFTGSNIIPDLTVKNGTLILKEGTDYTAACSNNRNTGTASVLITGKGGYSGTVTKTFTITKANQPLQVRNESLNLLSGETEAVGAFGNKGDLIYASSNPAVAAVDSTGQVRARSQGEALITVTAKMTMNYNKAVVQVPVRVGPVDISLCRVSFDQPSYPFTGNMIRPGITIARGSVILREGSDYTFTCTNNRNSGTASVQITGEGNYYGTRAESFTITKVDQDLKASLSPSLLKVGGAVRITASGNKGTLRYAVSDPAVVSVDDTGLVTALSEGSTEITVTASTTMNYNKAVVLVPVEVRSGEEGGAADYSYSFANTGEAFGYPAGYKIPYTSYAYLYGDNTRAEYIYSLYSRRPWEGNCAGMAATAALLSDSGSGIEADDFRHGAERAEDLSVTDSSAAFSVDVRTFIEAMQTSQHSNSFSTEMNANKVFSVGIRDGRKNLDQIVSGVKAQTDAGKTPVIAIKGGSGAHALLVYKTEVAGSGAVKMYLYDSNHPMEECTMQISGSGGHYTQWSYDMGSRGVWGSDDPDGWISYIRYDTLLGLWNKRGNLGRDDTSLAIVDSRNFEVYDVQGRLEAVVSGGELTDYTGSIVRAEALLDTAVSDTDPVCLYLPTKTYVIKNTDESASGFALELVDTVRGLSVNTTVREVTLAVDDDYDVCSLIMEAEEGDAYRVELKNSDLSDSGDVLIEGSGTGEFLSISQSGAELNISGGDISLLSLNGQAVDVYDVIAGCSQGGSIDRSGRTTVREGKALTYTITPDPGWSIQDVLVDNVSAGPRETYTFEGIDQDHTIYAVFAKDSADAGLPMVTSLISVQQGIKIGWTSCEGAASYRIYCREEGGSWEELTAADGLTWTWPGARSGSTYAFTVQAIDASGRGLSDYDTEGRSITFVAAPVITDLTGNNTGIHLAWNPCAGAGIYRIYYRSGDGGWKKLADVTDTSYTWTGAHTGVPYSFTVRCMNAEADSFVSGYDSTGRTITVQ